MSGTCRGIHFLRSWDRIIETATTHKRVKKIRKMMAHAFFYRKFNTVSEDLNLKMIQFNSFRVFFLLFYSISIQTHSDICYCIQQIMCVCLCLLLFFYVHCAYYVHNFSKENPWCARSRIKNDTTGLRTVYATFVCFSLKTVPSNGFVNKRYERTTGPLARQEWKLHMLDEQNVCIRTAEHRRCCFYPCAHSHN